MDLSGDDLAGVVDLFGGLTHDELSRAVTELAFKRGEDVEDDAIDATIEDALDSYHLVAVETDDGTRLVAGPTAFPSLPEGANDLPHIMDVDHDPIDRQTAAQAVKNRLGDEVRNAVESGDPDRIETLTDVTYDLDAWASVDLTSVRDGLDRAREQTDD